MVDLGGIWLKWRLATYVHVTLHVVLARVANWYSDDVHCNVCRWGVVVSKPGASVLV